MAIFNPFYGVILPFLFMFTLPIAIFASITTTFAISILFFRVLIVYIELALAVIPHWLLGDPPQPSQQQQYPREPFPRTKSFGTPKTRRKKRRGSTSSNLSATGSTTPISGGNENGFGVGMGIGTTRDYEGVGGWRVDYPSEDEGLWSKINSRLELPADHGIRRHHRSLTSGSVPANMRGYSPEATMHMNTSRARSPPSSANGHGNGYGAGEGSFPNVPVSPKGGRRTGSISTSSTSSKGSAGLTMKER
ncbi:hypothetical protein BUE80_DR001825 [Diplocarpon rosae]|nr:hypothetical protein BUE80_DR001825 [Diplocarpon rosae]